MTTEQAERQNIIDKFQEFLHRAPSEQEIATYTGTSNYQLEDYLRKSGGYEQSNDYQTQYAKLDQLGLSVFHYHIDRAALDQMVRDGYSLERALEIWRSQPSYKALYAGAPPGMSESDYWNRANTMYQNAQSTRDMWLKWTKTPLTDDQLRQIYIGSAGDDPQARALQNQFESIKAWEGARQSAQSKQQNTALSNSAVGPVEATMRGLDSGAGAIVGQDAGAVPPIGQPDSISKTSNTLQDYYNNLSNSNTDGGQQSQNGAYGPYKESSPFQP